MPKRNDLYVNTHGSPKFEGKTTMNEGREAHHLGLSLTSPQQDFPRQDPNRIPTRALSPQAETLCMDQNPTAWTRNPPYRLLPGGTFFSRKGISNFSLVSRDASRNLIQKCQQISRWRKEREMRMKISSLGAESTPRGHWGRSFRADGPACPAPALPAPPFLGA